MGFYRVSEQIEQVLFFFWMGMGGRRGDPKESEFYARRRCSTHHPSLVKWLLDRSQAQRINCLPCSKILG